MNKIAQSSFIRFIPGLLMLKEYQKSWLQKDILAGISVAAIALPVGIAYAALAGVPAIYGIYSAIFPLFIYALFGTSRQLIIGPDAATCLIVATSIAPLAAGNPERYLSLIALLTLLTGIVYLIAGAFRLGFLANFFSLPILTGYLNAIALSIIVDQSQKIMGISVSADHFFNKLYLIVTSVEQTNIYSLTIGLGLLVFLVIIKRLLPVLPSPLLTISVGIFLVYFLNLEQKGVAVLGVVPNGLPEGIKFPNLDFTEFKVLLRDATAIMLVSFTSGILTSKSFAQRNGYRVDANRELVGFGLGNIISGLCSGYPVTGADSRTAVNSSIGGKTQLVGIVAGLTMLAALYFLSGAMAFIPIPALAAVIIISAIGLFDFSTLNFLKHSNRIEYVLSIATTVGALIFGILPGILLAIGCSLILLIAAASKPKAGTLGKVKELNNTYHSTQDYPDSQTDPQIVVYRFEADLLFFNVDYFEDNLLEVIGKEKQIKSLVLDLSPASVIDVTSFKKLQSIAEQLHKRNIRISLAGQRQGNLRFFSAEWVHSISSNNEIEHFQTIESAVEYWTKQIAVKA